MIRILIAPHPILSLPARRVEGIKPRHLDLARSMVRLAEAGDGVGLAAPQIGRSIQLIVVRGPEGWQALFNPAVVKQSSEMEEGEEGCLSLPGAVVRVKRAKSVKVVADLPDGRPAYLEASGFLARVLQHEIDHLSGKMIGQ